MNDVNPYAAPGTPVEALPADLAHADSSEAPYFAVSTTKLVVLCVATLNIYSLYWFYKNWKQVKRTTVAFGHIRPFWRAFFSVFFTHELFRRVRVDAINLDVPTMGQADTRATLYVAAAIISGIASRFSPGFGLADLLMVLPIVALVLEQREINDVVARAAPSADRNSSFSAWNILTILAGAFVWLLLVIGMMLPHR